MIEPRTEETSSISSKTSKNERTMDYCTELTRSVGIFVTIARLLVIVAILMLMFSTDYIANMFLHVNAQENPTLLKIPKMIEFIFFMVFFQQFFVAAMGLYGFARLNVYMIAYFGTSSLLVVLGSSTLMVIMANRATENPDLKTVFLDQASNINASRKVELLQTNFHCCGSNYFNYNNFTNLPPSCCPPSKNETCTIERKFEKICETQRITLAKDGEGNAVTKLSSTIFIRMVLPVFECALAYYMIYRLRSETIMI